MDIRLTVLHPASVSSLCQTSGAFGQPLSAAQAQMLLTCQSETLLHLGRVDFSGGILPKLIQAFAPSPYILTEDWAQTLAQLTQLFYAFKNETQDAVPDDDLIAAMADRFNGKCGGSLENLADCARSEWISACLEKRCL